MSCWLGRQNPISQYRFKLQALHLDSSLLLTSLGRKQITARAVMAVPDGLLGSGLDLAQLCLLLAVEDWSSRRKIPLSLSLSPSSQSVNL